MIRGMRSDPTRTVQISAGIAVRISFRTCATNAFVYEPVKVVPIVTLDMALIFRSENCVAQFAIV